MHSRKQKINFLITVLQIKKVIAFEGINPFTLGRYFNPLLSDRTFTYFTLSNGRRFYSSMGKLLVNKGLINYLPPTLPINPLLSDGTFKYFTLSNARRCYSSMERLLVNKGLTNYLQAILCLTGVFSILFCLPQTIFNPGWEIPVQQRVKYFTQSNATLFYSSMWKIPWM